MDASITLLGEVVIDSIASWQIFAFFAFCMVLQLVYTHLLMPETKGQSLENIEHDFLEHEANSLT